jgi:hypothetical protein
MLDLRAIQNDMATALCHSRHGGNSTSVTVWDTFCTTLHLDPLLDDCADKIPVLQLFAHRYRSGELAPRGAHVRGKTVGDALRAVGQAFAVLGLPDPRLTPSGQLDIRLSKQLAAYNKADPSPTRVKPIPLSVLQHAVHSARQRQSPYFAALADMIALGFFFLLRPGEYAATSNPESSPFRLCDAHLMQNNIRLTPQQILAGHIPTFVALEFTTQKNGVRGELIGLGASGHRFFCPVLAVHARVLHLLRHQAPPATPLYTYYDHNTHHVITTTQITTALRVAVHLVGAPVGLLPADISVRSLRSSGAMALLCANVDTDRIRLLGRWRSDEMLRYLLLCVTTYTM